jgi:hypothetical protein
METKHWRGVTATDEKLHDLDLSPAWAFAETAGNDHLLLRKQTVRYVRKEEE